MKNRLKILLVITLMTVCLVNTTALAKINVPDLNKKGSIHINMKKYGEDIADGSLSIYEVGVAREEDGNYFYLLTDEFKESQLSLDDLQKESLPQQFSDYVKRKNISGVTKKIEQEELVFDSLDLGVYLIMQEEESEGYYPLDPFLVTVPFQNEGEWIYDVHAEPKTEIEEKPVVPEEHPDSKLPQTGQMKWPIPFLILGGILLFSLGWKLCFKRRTFSDER